jgi:hypothetical protein
MGAGQRAQAQGVGGGREGGGCALEETSQLLVRSKLCAELMTCKTGGASAATCVLVQQLASEIVPGWRMSRCASRHRRQPDPISSAATDAYPEKVPRSIRGRTMHAWRPPFERCSNVASSRAMLGWRPAAVCAAASLAPAL